MKKNAPYTDLLGWFLALFLIAAWICLNTGVSLRAVAALTLCAIGCLTRIVAKNLPEARG
jgi:hypothetical protein